MSKRNRANMPADFSPPVPAWSADWDGVAKSLTSAFFAVQGELTDSFLEWIDSALYGGESAPEQVERAQFVDRNGVKNNVYIAYWRDKGYEQWWSNPKVSDWWSSDKRLSEGVGYWREHYVTAVDHIETSHSSDQSHGIANLADELDGPIDQVGYAGAARDRIPVSTTEDLHGPDTISTFSSKAANDGKRVMVIPPAKMSVIRSGQDWGHCEADEREFYLDQVHPTLVRGMNYLSENAEESRCLSMRLMENVDNNGQSINQTFGLGYALDIFAFENWAKSHPTHLEIFGTFMKHAQKFAEKMKLRLWHEVSVLAPSAGEFEYINCHSKTGLLPYT